ncbi:MAG: hypothetical protein Q4A19_00530 [Johnsonella sp.]|nr:hypothetical protein [Johnsonella sp.]
MKALSPAERRHYSDLLRHTEQSSVISEIPQFFEAEIHPLRSASEHARDKLRVLVFNMERGVHLEEIKNYLGSHPLLSDTDIIIANELDLGCIRSGSKDTAKEIAEFLGMNYVYGLEFIELVNEEDPKGFHGNAIFSRLPIEETKVLRLPEKYNWYFDRQKRIGSRNAILAKIDLGGKKIALVCTHLENRTDGEGRRAQMRMIFEEAEKAFPGIPLIIGGDLNTNGFDGRDIDAIEALAKLYRDKERILIPDIFELCEKEMLLSDAKNLGYLRVPEDSGCTRRKPLPCGSYLPLSLDWILYRGLKLLEARILSTETKDFGFAKPDSALAAFSLPELSDHNAVWACFQI